MADLTQRLEASEIEAQRMADALEQMTAQNSALERDVQALKDDNDRLRFKSFTFDLMLCCSKTKVATIWFSLRHESASLITIQRDVQVDYCTVF